MGTVELRLDLIRILNQIEDKQLLRTIYDFLKQGEDIQTGRIWDTLSDEQKNEIYSSYEESEDETKMTSWDKIKKKY